MRPSRQLIALAVIFASLYAIVWFSGDGGWRSRLEPKLGLDLVGGTRVTLEARTEDGKAPPEDSLERARQIIEQRVNGLGVSEAEVLKEGDRNITVALAGKNDDRLKQIGSPAQLRFRTVVNQTTSTNTDPNKSASASTSPSGSTSASASDSTSASTSSTSSASTSASTNPSGSSSVNPSGSPGSSSAPTSLNEQQLQWK